MQASSTVTATAPVQPRRGVERRGAQAYLAEFVGTLLFVLFVGVVVSINSAGGLGFTDWAVIGLVHVFLLAMLVHTLGGASGAHLNPAVTVTLAALRRISAPDAAIYVAVQLLGGVAGALLVQLVLADEGRPANFGAPVVSEQFLQGRPLAGFLVEALGTFAVMWAIMGVAVDRRGARDWAGLVIGGTFGFAVMCFGPLTGAALNPARAFGPAVVAEAFNGVGDFLVAFILGPLVGALVAGILYTAGIMRTAGGRRPVDTLSGAEESPRGGP